MNSQYTYPTSRPRTLLRRALRGNGLFSGLSGLFFIVEAGPFASFIGLPWAWSLIVIGVSLVGYAAVLFYTAHRSPVDRRSAILFTILDVAWVVGSVILLVTNWVPFTVAGKWAVAGVADIVAAFAILQVLGLQRK